MDSNEQTGKSSDYYEQLSKQLSAKLEDIDLKSESAFDPSSLREQLTQERERAHKLSQAAKELVKAFAPLRSTASEIGAEFDKITGSEAFHGLLCFFSAEEGAEAWANNPIDLSKPNPADRPSWSERLRCDARNTEIYAYILSAADCASQLTVLASYIEAHLLVIQNESLAGHDTLAIKLPQPARKLLLDLEAALKVIAVGAVLIAWPGAGTALAVTELCDLVRGLLESQGPSRRAAAKVLCIVSSGLDAFEEMLREAQEQVPGLKKLVASSQDQLKATHLLIAYLSVGQEIIRPE